MNNHFDWLGLEVKDKVTGFQGVVSTVSFDLFGCIQVVVLPKVDAKGDQPDSRWFDTCRLDVTNEEPVMPRPDFSKKLSEQYKEPPGPVEKPKGRRACY